MFETVILMLDATLRVATPLILAALRVCSVNVREL